MKPNFAGPLVLRPATESDLEKLFQIHCAALRCYIEATWGWDEQFQRHYFWQHFVPQQRRVIQLGDSDIGFIDVDYKTDSIGLANIEIAPDWQDLGIGTQLIRELL